jgi:putative SOS response-associated peptidase YedK
MCNLYTMNASVDEMRSLFGPFEGDRDNLPAIGDIYPGYRAPVLRSNGDGLKLEMMTWGFPGPAAARSRPVTNVRNLDSPFWRSALKDPQRRCIVPVTRFCEWTAEADPKLSGSQKSGLDWLSSTRRCSPSPAFGAPATGARSWRS